MQQIWQRGIPTKSALPSLPPQHWSLSLYRHSSSKSKRWWSSRRSRRWSVCVTAQGVKISLSSATLSEYSDISLLHSLFATYHIIIRVVPSRISDLKHKSGQHQDYGFVQAKWQRNVASKRRYLRNFWKEPCRGCGFVTFVIFLRFSDILGFAKKTKKIHTVWQKPRNVTKFKSVTLWHLEMSQNVTVFQIFGTKLRVPFMFGLGSERLWM